MKRQTRQLRGVTPVSREQAIVVSTSRGARVLSLGEIDWIEAADNYARIWIGGRSYLLRESLRELERRMRAHGFARAHRRALVRLEGIRELTWTEAGGLVAVLGGGAKVRISRRQRTAFSAAVRSLARV